MFKEDQPGDAFEHLQLRCQAFDPGENHHAIESLVIDRGQKRPQIQLLFFAQTIDETLITVLLHDVVEPVENDPLLVHHQEHDFHRLIDHAT
ncbi:hypothetical protein D3C81_1588420 [compost metagenome]